MIEPLCKDSRCIVVGSAPGLELPAPLPGDVVMGANGGAALASKQGRVVQILVTTVHLFRVEANRQEVETRDSLRGLEFESIWVDEKNGPVDQVDLRQFGISYWSLHGVPPKMRSSVVWQAVGRITFPWVSTGIWAACLALVSGASEVVLAGISLSGGHVGMPWDSEPRYHVNEDVACLRSLIDKGVRVPTSVERML